MRARVVVVQPNALGQSSSPAILDGSFEFRQRLAIPVRIYCGPFRHKLGKQDAFSVPKRRSHHFSCGQGLLKLSTDHRLTEQIRLEIA